MTWLLYQEDDLQNGPDIEIRERVLEIDLELDFSDKLSREVVGP